MTAAQRSPKNIVVCCDGTGNQYGHENSNVVKLYTCLMVKDDQLAYYHPGVGTMGDPNQNSWIGRQSSRIAGLAFGHGFRANLADAYQFLMDNYADGDRIFLFGFSRGAYTVRALAGALFMYGLLCPGNEGHLPYLLEMFSTESRRAYKRKHSRRLQVDSISEGFRETFSRTVPIHFIGIWDTVSSIGWIYDPVKLLFDGQNPIVRKGRHAVSVDERRCFFQDNLWGPPLPPQQTPVLLQYPAGEDRSQDLVQAWFAGVHSDVGGSYLQSESGPAMDALRWILEEAEADGLQINEAKRDAIFGLPAPAFPAIAAMNPRAQPLDYCIHDSLTWRWWPLEFFPHKYFDQNGRKRWRLQPWPHRRELPDGALIHPSLRRRLEDPTYKPKNLDPARISDYSRSPVSLLQPRVIAQLRALNYGVYRLQVASQDQLLSAAGAQRNSVSASR
jgi:uncharacterized protein (DUF2235 family)